jgi:hypothetical protein
MFSQQSNGHCSLVLTCLPICDASATGQADIMHLLTSDDASIESSKAVVQELFSQIIIKRLLAAIARFVSVPCRPIRLVKGESMCLLLDASALRSVGYRFRWGVKEGLVALHSDELSCSPCKLWTRVSIGEVFWGGETARAPTSRVERPASHDDLDVPAALISHR